MLPVLHASSWQRRHPHAVTKIHACPLVISLGHAHAQARVSQDYIGGVALSPDGRHVIAAAADGTASLLDARRGGARVSFATAGTPLRCAAMDGRLALLGAESGQARC